MFYIHGGSYLTGSGSGKDATPLCEEGVVFVSMNYRLGVLGGLTLPELLSESNTSGNYALQDQRAALAWVRRNIHLFGGDPDRITISGESAGAMSVAAHYALPRSAPYFAQAIIMSGNDDSLSFAEAARDGDRFAAFHQCRGPDRAACLRRVDALELVNAQTVV